MTAKQTLRISITVVVLLNWVGYGCNSKSPTIQQPSADPDKVNVIAIDLVPIVEELSDGSSRFKSQQIQVEHDFLFKGPKRYEGVKLSEVIKGHLPGGKTLMDFTSIKLVCKDGYEPAHRIADVPIASGWLVFRDLDAPVGSPWEPEKVESYSPSYLLWDHENLDPQSVSWPYGLVRIELSVDDPHGAITPNDDEIALQGFQIYEHRCIKCHAINKVGGHVGPELNYPKSITEYWDKEIIWQYTKDPQSFRYNSQMHGTEDLSREEFELLYRYLSYMKDREPS